MDHRPVGIHSRRAVPGVETTALAFAQACEIAEVQYVFTGGLAVLAWGRKRTPMDLQARVRLDGEQIEGFAHGLQSQGLEGSADDFSDSLKDQTPIVVSDPASGHQFEVKIATTATELQKIENGVLVPFSEGTIRVDCAQDLVASLLASGSPRDLLDARSILARQGDRIDLPLLKETARREGVELVLASILDEIG